MNVSKLTQLTKFSCSNHTHLNKYLGIEVTLVRGEGCFVDLILLFFLFLNVQGRRVRFHDMVGFSIVLRLRCHHFTHHQLKDI